MNNPLRNGAIAGLLASFAAAGWTLAKHPSNAGPEDPPIKYPIPERPALSPQDEMKTFKIEEGFRIELVAADPLVQDPIALSFDEKGRVWVVEYRGYMHDIEGLGENQPLGRIVILEDTDGDGVMDKSTVFLDKLVMPRAVMVVNGGALVAEPPNLMFCRDTNGDGVADEKTIIANNFGSKGGQPEHMANGPLWGLDNWIYSAAFPVRFKLVKGKGFIPDASRARGQWGLTQDDFGRLFYNYNSDFLRADLLPYPYMTRNPFYQTQDGTNVKVMADQSTWPSHPTPGVNRGYTAGQLRDDGTLKTCTATCGPGVYRGDLFGKDYYGDVFIPEPSGNMVKRVTLTQKNNVLTAHNAYQGKEFWTSTDERFRPVNAYTGPDGALWVVDLYRGVLQHKAFLTNYLIKNIKERHLEEGINKGRIWRIVPNTAKTPAMAKLPTDTPGLVASLASGNGWVRDTAQRLLVERGDAASIVPLKRMIHTGPMPLSRLQALWTLEGMGKLEQDVAMRSLADADPLVKASAIRLCEPFLSPAFRAEILPELAKLADDPDPAVQLQLALTTSAVPAPEAEAIAAKVLAKNIEDPLIRDAVVTGLRGRELEFITHLTSSPAFAKKTTGTSSMFSALAQCVLTERRTARMTKLLEIVTGQAGANAWRQVAMLQGMSGTTAGTKGKAGPVVKLVYLESKPQGLEALLQSPEKGVAAMAARVDARLAWPGKPGVPPPPVIIPLTPAQQKLFERGREVYAGSCIGCHQPNGLGQDGLAPPLVDSEWVLGPPSRNIRIVLQGVSGPITVNGTHHALEMPGLAQTYSDEDIASVLTYVRREWEHNAAPVTPEQVITVRNETAGRLEPWTAKELSQVK
jgi:mono/diheme cytochrome c family protein/glucose/arabinose dehydrogenase